MKVVDLNLLIYAINRDSPMHDAARAWLEATFAGDESVGVPWVVILGFLRMTTSARILPAPLSAEQALSVVDSWLSLPSVVPLSPADGHWPRLRATLADTGTAANLTADAHLATLAIEHDAELCSTDADFARFPALRWTNPLAGR